MREEREVLEGARDPAPDDLVRRNPEEVVAVEDDAPPFGLVEPRDDVERGRLAGAVRPDQPDDLALLGRERHVVERENAAEAAGQVLDREERHDGPRSYSG